MQAGHRDLPGPRKTTALMFEVVKKWEDSGLLLGVDEQGNKIELACRFQDMADCLTSHHSLKYPIDVVAFPVVRRIFYPSMTRIPAEDICYQLTLLYMRFPVLSKPWREAQPEELVDLWNEMGFSEVYKREGMETPSPSSIDFEAEATARFCEFLIDDYTNKEVHS